MQHLPVGADGFYVGKIIDHSVEMNEESGSVSLASQIQLTRSYDEDTKQWEDISAHDYFIYGRFNMVGKGGAIGATQKKTVQTIQDLFNWTDGDLLALQNTDTTEFEVMVDCKTKPDDKGEERIRAEWLYAPVDEPRRGGMNKMDETKLASVSNKYAAQFRALAKPKAAEQPTFAGVKDDGGPGF